ncbi:ASKHA domain-containing protein [Pseudodesulfovibrio sp.]|uniref:ASKHA domain-containing protein n=1 Tax=unclassified Pseudodesulfovibrio TaxID=2661612 RepID=UPI003AFFC3E4
MSILIHTHDGARFALEPKEGDTLARTIFLSRLWHGVPLCSGLGKCGLCRVRFRCNAPESQAAEVRKLGRSAIEEGWRLACLHPSAPCEIDLPEPVRSPRAVRELAKGSGDFSLAVDLGTTSLHWTVLCDGVRVASGQELNPQVGMGSEVMSRLAAAATAEGRFVLRALIVDRLSELVRLATGVMGGQCTSMAVSGNPAMIYILLGKRPDDLAAAPYELSYRGGEEKKLGPGMPPVYLAPLLAPFVGGDLSAGLVAVEYAATPEYPFLLADLGTNGEFILALSPVERVCASVPMGPALEGMGLSFGRTAGPGAITRFRLTPKGLEWELFGGGTGEPVGMTGTAYLSLTAILLRHGVLGQDGQFGRGTTPLAGRLAERLTSIEGEPAFAVTDTLYLPASDVEEILKVKAAFNLAMSALLREAGIGPSKLAAIQLAGALGEHVGLDDLETLGFLPPGFGARTVRAGNTSLLGTELLLADADARIFAEGVADSLKVLELAGDPSFGDGFVKRMQFSYVD